MGYYTNYSLETNDNIVNHEENISELYSIYFGDDIKWYEHEKDMKEYSKLYSNVLFELKGKGEEYDDMWVKYFLDGKMQVETAKITFEKFDIKKLK